MSDWKQPPKVKKQLSDVIKKYESTVPVMMPTKIIPFDLILGGGITKGSFLEISGQSGIGKSTLLAQTAKNMCKQGYKVMFWDFENALTKGLKTSIGLIEHEGNEFYHLEMTTYSDADDVMSSVIADPGKLDIIIIDSEASMVPDAVMEGSDQIGIKARATSNFLLKYKGFCRKNGVSIFFINQMRTKIQGKGRFMIASEDSSGGNAMKHYCDIRLRMDKAGDLKRNEETINGVTEVIYGSEVNIWALKNKEVRSHIKITVPIIFGKGVSVIQILSRLIINMGFVERKASYFIINFPGLEKTTVQGLVAVDDFCRANKNFIMDHLVNNDLLFLSRGIV